MSDAESTAGLGLVDRLKGTAKQVAGAVTGNEDLKQEGQLHHDKVEAANEAADLRTAADHEVSKAELAAREQQIEIERKRLQAETAADNREQQIERQRRTEEHELAAEAKRREAGVEQQSTAQADALDRQERQVAVERAEAERHASQLDAAAAYAKDTASQLEAPAQEIS